MKTSDVDNVFSMLDHLAWCRRANLFEDDFKTKFKQYLKDNSDYSELFIKIMANTYWNSVSIRGLVETFQEYIQDEVCNRALAHAISVGTDIKNTDQ